MQVELALFRAVLEKLVALHHCPTGLDFFIMEIRK